MHTLIFLPFSIGQKKSCDKVKHEQIREVYISFLVGYTSKLLDKESLGDSLIQIKHNKLIQWSNQSTVLQKWVFILIYVN